MQQRKAVRARVHRFDATGEIKVGPDSLAGEEPLEVNLDGEQFSVTMRTPGNDVELVSGYLLSEGVITSMADIAEIDFSTGLAPDGSRNYNVAGVRLRPGVWNAAAAPARSVYTSSSCGICGTAAIDAVTKPSAYPLIPLLGVGGDQAAGTGTAPAEGGGPDAEPEARGGGIAVPSDAPHLDEDGDIVFPPLLSPARVGELPDRLREGQAVFEKTGESTPPPSSPSATIPTPNPNCSSPVRTSDATTPSTRSSAGRWPSAGCRCLAPSSRSRPERRLNSSRSRRWRASR